MTIIYIVLGIIFVILAVYMIDRRDKMKREIRMIRMHKKDIDDLNRQLDDIQTQLDEVHEPLVKLNHFCQKVLKYINK